MDSYDFSRETGRPVSPPLPEDYSMGYLPQMSTYSGASQSRTTSVPQPIDFGGTASGYSGASQSRNTSVPQIEYGGSASGYNGSSQSRRTSAPLIEYGSSSQSGRTTGSGSRASQQTNARYHSDEVKSKALSEMQQELARGGTIRSYASRSTIPYATLTWWHGQLSGSRPGRQYASAEEKASRLSELQQELDRGGTIKDYSERTGISLRTLTKWRQDARSRNS